jgi:hypothetical protein
VSDDGEDVLAELEAELNVIRGLADSEMLDTAAPCAQIACSGALERWELGVVLCGCGASTARPERAICAPRDRGCGSCRAAQMSERFATGQNVRVRVSPSAGGPASRASAARLA